MEENEIITWKKQRKYNKELKKKYKQENLIKKLEKQKQKENEILSDGANENIEELKGSESTLSIAVPGSILENAQSAELRTYVAGQVARAACIFKVDEVIVFDDGGNKGPSDPKQRKLNPIDGEEDQGTVGRSCLQMARILQYLECPQYLRKFFFPLHKDLKYSGLLNPLDAPHHLRQQNEFIYREGAVTNKPAKNNKGSYVNIGLLNDCLVDKVLEPGLRVTVKLKPGQDLRSRKIQGTIVSPSEPKVNTGIYWGYTVRIAKSFSEVFTKSPYANGYDVTIGTSDKGRNVHDVPKESMEYNHALILYGGLQGLEPVLENDDNLDAEDPSLIFDYYLNAVPGQGSRTIRTEEAILISLAALEDKLKPMKKSKEVYSTESIAQSKDTGIKQFCLPKKQGKKQPQQRKQQENATNELNEEFLSRFD